jgi:hypothetical protein
MSAFRFRNGYIGSSSVGYFKSLSISRSYRADDTMNDELERIWKETVVAQSSYNASICLEGLKKTARNLS